ncbi:cation:dicarboxylate symporter family transporter [Tersicoccus sp. Bi-70]|uniref:cation:dicarboxylate symporter family transporter n=1 Tax=Tersicoccus sp. Bi-70 TaxID=1897634 RepID=UPI0018E92B8C|nr:cation:dicarboxylase symporter family transporter [Tersicoccus sp. Bi-70]
MRSLLKSAFGPRLYITVAVAIVLGAIVGFVFPSFGASLAPVGTGFIQLIQMLIAPVVFCTIVTGIAGAGKLTSVGRIGVKALVYFELMTTIALAIGLVVMNLLKPGAGIHANANELKLNDTAQGYVSTGQHQNWYDFILNIIPKSFVGAFTDGNVLQVLLIAVLFAVAVKMLGARGDAIVSAVGRVNDAIFGIIKLIMYLAPIGAFGAMAYTTGKFGVATLVSLGSIVVLFWVIGILFCLLVFGAVARICGLRVLAVYRYFKDEILITLGTSNYEAVMPQLMRKLEGAGCPKPIVGLVVPSGYAFNGDGVCLYLGFASLYIAQAFDIDLSIWQQIALLAVFMLTSKGSAGVAGAGFVILAATLSSTGTVPVVGIMLILGVDRFLSTMRGLVSLSGQMMGSLVVSVWERQLDRPRALRIMRGLEAPLVQTAEPTGSTATAEGAPSRGGDAAPVVTAP